MIDCMPEAVPPVGLARYGALFRVPHVRRLVLSGMLARLPAGMIGLALLLLVREHGGSYAAAGAVSGCYFVATAVGAPISGRLVDRRGQARILLSRALIFPTLLAAVCVLAVVDAPIALVALGAAGAGVMMPPVGASLRSLWPRMFVDGDLRAAAYALEASLQEITFIVGPLLVALLTAAFSPVVALGVAAAVGGVGTLLIAVAEPVRAWRPEEVHEASVLGSIPLSLFAAGSLVGGLVAGARVTMPPLRLLRVSAVLLALGLALPLLGWSLASMSVLAFVAGLAIAPVVMAAYGLVDAVAARGTAAEAFSWITTAVFAGFSGGMAVGGTLIDAYGPKASFVLAVAAAAVGAVLVAVGPGLEPS